MSKQLRIGIIGSGGIAKAHVAAYRKLPFVEIVAVADVIPGKAADFVEALQLVGAAAYDGHRKLLEQELDAVSICTPNVSHHETTVDSLKAGKQVLLEKPMSVTLAEALEMTQVARDTGNMLSIGFQPRYDPNMKLLQEIVQSGRLGKVYYAETGGGRRRGMPGGTFISKKLAGAGAMADIGCYSLDMALNTLGYPRPLSVSAFTSNHFGRNPLYHPEASRFEVEDFGVAMVRFENDLVLQFKISWAMHMDTLGATMFLGTDAGLKITPAGSGPWSGVWDGSVGSVTLYHDEYGRNTQTPIPLIEHKLNLFDEKVRDFAEAVRDGRPAPIPGEQILIQQAIIDGVLRSAELGREVSVELPRND
ncbi:Gfo/Idh/MocA family oxidoreductase [Paenibacillus phoenicis]|uniref:Gfo/Idh/MocA family oxidoreductase n=1 Tax=Paenibacillus phoenicis TaxID=554117 RepID=A0ABU5PF62_9BACL|nr:MULTISPECIES: Gfo/Idh/MocA family oxidoreductase [Paenibacillus]EES71883.1 oxidoreductase, NAD-binding domain protein [Paenibacillus sp. oral taxon 786 str. D14]MCT2193873.1 Gfo/Idh/MocA family oxidoreductase [Paenibacillus sp. p3-SID1389]MEA3568580.1 Gfo/Idh/MocA family oxidoreductase [Paenibacillus phoenicis]